jgi:uncharacterized protein (TIGR02246 family)
MESDENAVRAVHTTFIEAVNARDLDRVLSLMTDDVVFLGPGNAPFGRDQFPVGFLAGHQEWNLRCTSELQEIAVVGDMAYAWCNDSLAMTRRADGQPAALSGHRLSIYRKQPDGRWLLARDAHTLTPVAG